MNDTAQTARDDLAFIRGVVEDKDPLPWVFGAHLLTPGLLFAPGTFFVWASLSGLIDTPEAWLNWSWVPGMVLYAPLYYWLTRVGGAVNSGPGKRAFAAAWAAMGMMTLTALVALSIAASTLHDSSVLQAWPVLALTFYGGAWTVLGVAHQRRLYWIIALGSFATAVFGGFVMQTPTQWLVLALGILAWIAAPGLYIIVRARTARV